MWSIVIVFISSHSPWIHSHIHSLDQNCFYKAVAVAVAAAAKSLQSCDLAQLQSPTLCDPRDGSPPGSPVPGILQARTLEWVAISFSNVWKWKVKSESEVAQSYPTLVTPWTVGGHGLHGIFQARVLEWVAIAFSNTCLKEYLFTFHVHILKFSVEFLIQ